MRKAIVVGIAVAVVIAAWKNALGVFIMLVFPCGILLLLIWGLARFFGLVGLSKWSENIRVALALTVVVGFFLFCGVMARTNPRDFFRHAELNAEMQKVTIERNKVRIGMTINEVLPHVHGMDIVANAMVPAILHHKFDGGEVLLKRDGAFWYKCEWAGMGCTLEEMEKEIRLTESQAAELMKQKMSDGYEWRWWYISAKDMASAKDKASASFSVTFGRDGRVKDISEVQIDKPARFHPM